MPDIGGTNCRDLQHVGASVEARDVELAGVVAGGHGFAASLVERRPGNRTAAERPARTIAVAEIVGRAEIQPVVEDFLPDKALVVTGVALTARAVAAAGVENELLEVVDVGESSLIRGEFGIAVGIAPDICDVTRQRVLPSDRKLAEHRALETDPGVAIEENAGRVHISARQLEFALHAGNQIEVVFREELLLDEDAPSVAAEPGRVQSDRRASLGIHIGGVAKRRLDDAVKQNIGIRGFDDVDGPAGDETIPRSRFSDDRTGRRYCGIGVLLPLHLLQLVVKRLHLAPLLFHFGQALVHGPDLGL